MSLAAAKMLGPRIGRWDSSKEPAMGSATNTIIGVFMLWWAWVAFNQVKTIIIVFFIRNLNRAPHSALVASAGYSPSALPSPLYWPASPGAWWAWSTASSPRRGRLT